MLADGVLSLATGRARGTRCAGSGRSTRTASPEERVVRAAVDVAMRPCWSRSMSVRSPSSSPAPFDSWSSASIAARSSSVARSAASAAALPGAHPHLREARKVADVDPRDEHPAARINLRPQLQPQGPYARLADRSSRPSWSRCMRSRSTMSDPSRSSSETISSRMRS